MAGKWIKGPPPEGVFHKAYWLLMEDQGGYPSVNICHVFAKLNKDKLLPREEYASNELYAQAHDAALETWATDGEGRTVELRHVWKVAAHMPIEQPEVPDYSTLKDPDEHEVVLGCQVRDRDYDHKRPWIRNEKMLEHALANPDRYTYDGPKAHWDEDYSYICCAPHCRCIHD